MGAILCAGPGRIVTPDGYRKFAEIKECDRTLSTAYLEFPHGDCLVNVAIYKLSVLFLAHWVLRKNLSDDLIDGSLLKQLISIL